MRENNISGHVIHMNAIAGHYVPSMPEPNFNVYPASKFAVTALTESLRQELRYHKTGIKVTVRLRVGLAILKVIFINFFRVLVQGWSVLNFRRDSRMMGREML